MTIGRGLNGERLPIAFDGVARPANIQQQDASVVERAGVARINLQRLLEARRGFLVTAKRLQQKTAIVERVRIRWRRRKDAIHGGQRVLAAAKRQQCGGPAHQRGSVVRRPGERAIVARL